MKLTIVIVNYNVKYFLEQCLHSVYKALNSIDAEVCVVDNASSDQSVEMVAEKFPDVKLIANKDNVGFSKANNQAIREANGEYVLLLNPDTVVEEDTFDKVVSFMDEHSDAGGLGVKMIDGKGSFLPESKRGLPTPSVAFYKIFGLSKLFPKSKIFGKYHLGYLANNEIHEVDVLAGAFMLLRKSVLDEIGLLDEDYFMYGEDIDLSYRIQKSGAKNYYYPDTSIIHYKGESTKKGSINYVFVFYRAMVIFAKKHFTSSNAQLFAFLINMAIYLRAGGAIVNRFIKRIAFPLLDAGILYGGMFYLKHYWENNHRFVEGGEYPIQFMLYAVPAYIIVWLTSVFFSGGYDKPYRLSKIIRGIGAGTIVILVIYALLSEDYRFSRALILLGAVWAALAMPSIRLLLNVITKSNILDNRTHKRRVAIVGESEETNRLLNLLGQTSIDTGFTGIVSINSTPIKSTNYIGEIDQLDDLVSIYQIDEVIFCAKDISSQDIISQMAKLSNLDVAIKIAPPESLYIIGSNSINTQGELYALDVNAITSNTNKRNKRVFDISISIVLIILFPVMLFFVKKPFSMLVNCLLIFVGKRTWVGYSKLTEKSSLPKIKSGILNPIDNLNVKSINNDTSYKLNALYAKEYNIKYDFDILLSGIKHLGRRNIGE